MENPNPIEVKRISVDNLPNSTFLQELENELFKKISSVQERSSLEKELEALNSNPYKWGRKYMQIKECMYTSLEKMELRFATVINQGTSDEVMLDHSHMKLSLIWGHFGIYSKEDAKQFTRVHGFTPDEVFCKKYPVPMPSPFNGWQ